MGEVRLSRRELILTAMFGLKLTSHGFVKVFRNNDIDLIDGDLVTLQLPKDTWEDMGSPDEVTVSIRPGDHLNRIERPREDAPGPVGMSQS